MYLIRFVVLCVFLIFGLNYFVFRLLCCLFGFALHRFCFYGWDLFGFDSFVCFELFM